MPEKIEARRGAPYGPRIGPGTGVVGAGDEGRGRGPGMSCRRCRRRRARRGAPYGPRLGPGTMGGGGGGALWALDDGSRPGTRARGDGGELRAAEED